MHIQGDYSKLPFDILLELVSMQSLPKLMSSRLLGSQWRMAADCALFARQNEQAIEHQERLLQLWGRKSATELNALFSEGAGLFKRHLLASIQSAASNSYHRLSRLRVLAAMNYCPVSISPEVTHGLLNKLDDQDWAVREAALKALLALLSPISKAQLTKAHLKTGTTQISQKPNNAPARILRRLRRVALKALLSSLSLMNNQDVNECADRYLVDLNDSSARARMTGLQVCSLIVKFMNETQRATFVIQVTDRLNDLDWDVRLAALRASLVISNKEDAAKHVTTFIDQATKELRDSEALVRKARLKALSSIMPLMTENQYAEFIIQVEEKWHDLDDGVCKAALKILSIIARGVTEASTGQKLNEIANEALNDPNWRIREHALNLASTLVVLGKYQRINVEQLADPSVEALVLESLRQMYSRDAIYGKLEPGEQLSTNKAANAAVVTDEQHAGTVQSESMLHAGHNRLLNGIGFFGVETMQTNDPEIALHAPAV